MRRSILKSLAAGTVIVLAVAAMGCRHTSGKGMSCCGPGAQCGPSKASPPASQGQGAQK